MILELTTPAAQALDRLPVSEWRCPESGCIFQSTHLVDAIIHTNNAHHWTWDMFANKFRERWQDGKTT